MKLIRKILLVMGIIILSCVFITSCSFSSKKDDGESSSETIPGDDSNGDEEIIAQLNDYTYEKIDKGYVIRGVKDKTITNAIIPYGVTNIGYRAFYRCSSLTKVYYEGNSSNWNNIDLGSNSTCLTDATIYYYSETQPTDEGNYWHYVDGVVIEW